MCRLLAIAALVVPLSLEGQLEPGALVRKDALLSTLPPDSLYPQPREVVRARTGPLSTMAARLADGEPPSARLLHREAFVALHNQAGRRSFEPYDEESSRSGKTRCSAWCTGRRSTPDSGTSSP